ncbi:hypothetical protein A5784_11910 [Mycobacterium sp. 852013-50091_SCH5140682]|uniref:DUF7159 family protein n=1 Tax=Mycobacterium sp. 852013-50091_SCH5140682 TaxID=1834109 RepID=UPI0007EBA468|nr:hypothetical protein [Mycobacterium sp. 852013-50091_SCH5140682]OBC04801.1 hypothetical protein A5784_11910 [Mycobacterium sp. 852013-50091_SCH5140682]
MDLVLGLSMTSNVVRWVLVDGITGEGAPVDRGALDISDADTFDAEALLENVLGGGELHAVGLTWSAGADAVAAKVRSALDAVGGGARVVDVPDVEAAEVLAGGIAEISDYHFLVVCLVEPDAALIATVNDQRVRAERIDRIDSALVDQASSAVRNARPSPDAVFVLGSDVEAADALVAVLRDETARPVFTAAEADLALTRGAALAAARTVNAAPAPVAKPLMSRVGVLSSVLAAAVVVFVVSLSLALGLRLTPPETELNNTGAVEQSVRPAPPPVAQPAVVHPAPAAPPPVHETVAAAPPPAPVQEASVPEPAYVPPAPEPEYVPPAPEPAYVPPAPPEPPVYVPPPVPVYAPPPPPPRLRDRIIEKIPLINRFH